MTTIATTHITDMWHFDKVAFGGSWTSITQFGQVFCRDLRIVSDLFLYPTIKFLILRDILRNIMGDTLSNIFSNSLSAILTQLWRCNFDFSC